jgi:asparagine synthase (glutamine-hydrolysing)
MPGIVGIISRKPVAECERQVKSMTALLRHESFHRTGFFSVPEMGVFAGWIAQENSFAANQTYFNEQKDLALVFSGECFADAETKNQLRQNGHDFSEAGGDWLVHLYEALGERFFETLNGLFSGLLVDRRRNKIFLFNDRYAMERIYWHETADAFYFASEAKALLRILPELRDFDEEGVTQFLAVGCPLDGRTLFRGVQLLPGGSRWTFENGGSKREKYFSPEVWESQPVLGMKDFEIKFRETFSKILPRYFASSSPLGIALTGGLDTRMIMACLPSGGKKPTTYTFSGQTGRTLDDRVAARVADACSLEHQLLRLQPDFFSNFAAHADRTVFVTDGSFGILGAHEIYFNRQARELSPVRLTGNFGSEVFRGVSTFKPLELSPQLFNATGRNAVTLAAAKVFASEKNRDTFAVFKEVPQNLFGSVAAGRSQITFRTPYLDNDLVALAYQTPVEYKRSAVPALNLVNFFSPQLGRIPTDRGLVGGSSKFMGFLRHAAAEVTCKLDYCSDAGLPRRLAFFDPVFQPVVRQLKVVGLHKFLKYNTWLRNDLAGYAQQMLADSRTRPGRFWDPNFIGQMMPQHIGGRKNFTAEINSVLTLEAVERLLFRELPRGNEIAG